MATYTDGTPTENAGWFYKWLEETSTDFRYGKTYLKGMRYAVFGLGNSVYVGHYNTVRAILLFLIVKSFYNYFYLVKVPPQARRFCLFYSRTNAKCILVIESFYF